MMFMRSSFASAAVVTAAAFAALAGIPVPAHAQPASGNAGSTALSPAEARVIAAEAYIYLYPLLSMEVTRRQAINSDPGVAPGRGPANTFAHMRAFPDAEFRAVVRPNFDTLYSSAFLDLTAGPVIVSHADTAGRFFMLPMLDMWSDVFAVPGKRTSGTGAADFAVVPAGWTGQLPAGVQRIDAPTPHVWVIGRTQTNGPKDYDAVHQVQAGYRITALSQWGKPAQPPAPVKIDPSIDMKTPPKTTVDAMPAAQYFAYAAETMKVSPPHATDWSVVARMKRIGIEPGKSFDLAAVEPGLRSAIEAGAADGLKMMLDKLPTLARVVNGWQMNTDTMGVYGDYYLKRAIVAMAGLGANQPDDAVYPLCITDGDGKPVMGENKYVLRFTKAQLPPANAFWSLTMYDAEGFQVANPINRFAIGDRDALKFNSDGSLDLYIQHENPGQDKESNWLPTPASGELGLTLRLYAPRAEVLDGRWAPPPVQRAR